MNEMMFDNYLIDQILVGRKTQTSRTKRYEVGRIENLMSNYNYSKLTGNFIKITKVYQKRLGAFTNQDAKKEGFSDLQEFIDYVNKQGKKLGFSWNPNQVVCSLSFRLALFARSFSIQLRLP